MIKDIHRPYVLPRMIQIIVHGKFIHKNMYSGNSVERHKIQNKNHLQELNISAFEINQ